MKRKPRTIKAIALDQNARLRDIDWSVYGTHAVLCCRGVMMPPLSIGNSESDGRQVVALWIREARASARAQCLTSLTTDGVIKPL